MKRQGFIFISLSFLFAFVPYILSLFLFPDFRLNFLIPFLIFFHDQRSLSTNLYCALFLGVFMDLISYKTPFGMYAVCYTLTNALMYSIKKFFFQDQILSIPILTFIFSILLTFLQIVILKLYSYKLALSFTWIISDLLIFPLFDSLFALVGFVFPLFYLSKNRWIRKKIKTSPLIFNKKQIT